MKFGNISRKVLNIKLGEYYDEDMGFYTETLKSALLEVGEDIFCAKYKTSKHNGVLVLDEFTAWSQDKVMFMVDSGFLDKMIVTTHRNPPITGRKK